jgi:hypothetical protein
VAQSVAETKFNAALPLFHRLWGASLDRFGLGVPSVARAVGVDISEIAACQRPLAFVNARLWNVGSGRKAKMAVNASDPFFHRWQQRGWPRLDSVRDSLRIGPHRALSSVLEHDLLAKPRPTFPDHSLASLG